MATLTDLDRRLLSALREDGRTPVAELARRLGVTRATVTSRIDRLVAEGVIIGFTVRVRDEAETGGVRAVSLIEVEGRTTDQVIDRLRGFPEIEALHSTNGAWDLVAETRTSDLAEFDRLLGRIRSVPGVLNSETSLLLTSVLR
ncbi:Lrp/AsnC family transcriptional regulator [Blastococcus sp. TF02A-35]|uniref:Lrp/AsnC family transcriptional regulator n=1 Tax=Blastococcus sp. TF02A-35 TaxID=2559612 RepID=UPI0010734B2A|nr:Lrp/AsnC family transcriptional regulator [Blastococcus sp. TF02A_35]TFV52667.1 Lrp/AsnC family transcriptional regulator [Blastococcus sp. TF02A_35]